VALAVAIVLVVKALIVTVWYHLSLVGNSFFVGTVTDLASAVEVAK
jgi:hypothetical protein